MNNNHQVVITICLTLLLCACGDEESKMDNASASKIVDKLQELDINNSDAQGSNAKPLSLVLEYKNSSEVTEEDHIRRNLIYHSTINPKGMFKLNEMTRFNSTLEIDGARAIYRSGWALEQQASKRSMYSQMGKFPAGYFDLKKRLVNKVYASDIKNNVKLKVKNDVANGKRRIESRYGLIRETEHYLHTAFCADMNSYKFPLSNPKASNYNPCSIKGWIRPFVKTKKVRTVNVLVREKNSQNFKNKSYKCTEYRSPLLAQAISLAPDKHIKCITYFNDVPILMLSHEYQVKGLEDGGYSEKSFYIHQLVKLDFAPKFEKGHFDISKLQGCGSQHKPDGVTIRC